MKKILFFVALLVVVLTGCYKTFDAPKEVAEGVATMYDKVNSLDYNYEYEQKSKDYYYTEDYIADKKMYDVKFHSSSKNGDLEITYRSYIDNNNIDDLKVLEDGKYVKSDYSEDQINAIVKNGSTLYDIHSEFLNTYKGNLSSGLKFKNMTEDEESYKFYGKSKADNDLIITIKKDYNQINVVDQTREIEQVIKLK